MGQDRSNFLYAPDSIVLDQFGPQQNQGGGIDKLRSKLAIPSGIEEGIEAHAYASLLRKFKKSSEWGCEYQLSQLTDVAEGGDCGEIDSDSVDE
jgi:hypothetical protein